MTLQEAEMRDLLLEAIQTPLQSDHYLSWVIRVREALGRLQGVDSGGAVRDGCRLSD